MYSGFGLRKEVYTRKPKKLFDKVRKLYKEEALNRFSDHSNENPEELKRRIRKKLERNATKNAILRIFIIAFITFILAAGILLVRKLVTFTLHTEKYPNKSAIFKTLIYRNENGERLKVDYFTNGPKASETQLKNGLKHQNSESFYETGEQFRSALYFHDTLITETYFYKNGDTIKNFPVITRDVVIHIVIPRTPRSKKLEFDFYDGKIITSTYREE
jgi:hypothetical protein